MFGNGPLFLWWASSPYSWGIPLFGHELLVLIGLGAFGLSAISLSLLLFAKSRLTGVALLVGSLIYVISTPVAIYAGSLVRMQGFEQFAQRAEPLIDAIQRYDNDYDRPPETLKNLVPKYIAEIPPTGVGSAPHFGYRNLVNDKTFTDSRDRWMLQLDVGTGLGNWDVFIFLPTGEYQSSGWGRSRMKRLGRWAYVYE